MELETHLIIATDLGYFKPEDLEKVQKLIEGIGQLLNRLIQVLRTRRPMA